MQSSVERAMVKGRAGGLADSGHHDIITRINNGKQRVEATVTAADLETTITINGTAFTDNVGGGARTKAVIAAALIVLINAGSEPVTASAGSGTDKIYIDADVSGTAFTAVGTTNASVADIILNELNIPFGVLVVEDTTGLSDERAHLPQATGDVTTVVGPLGRNFTLEGLVIEGVGRGKGLGFPTANLSTEKEILPNMGLPIPETNITREQKTSC